MIKQFYFKQFSLACRHFKWFQVLLCITNKAIKYQPFVYTQLNNQTALFQTIQLSISHLFALSLNVKVESLNVKQFYLTHR